MHAYEPTLKTKVERLEKTGVLKTLTKANVQLNRSSFQKGHDSLIH